MPLVSQVFDVSRYALRDATGRDVEKNADVPIKHIAIQLLEIADAHWVIPVQHVISLALMANMGLTVPLIVNVMVMRNAIQCRVVAIVHQDDTVPAVNSFVQLVFTAGTVAKVVTVKMVQHVIPEMASVFARQDILVISVSNPVQTALTGHTVNFIAIAVNSSAIQKPENVIVRWDFMVRVANKLVDQDVMVKIVSSVANVITAHRAIGLPASVLVRPVILAQPVNRSNSIWKVLQNAVIFQNMTIAGGDSDPCRA